jgi:uncharacterized membrane protein HdeD (DUF308 family)
MTTQGPQFLYIILVLPGLFGLVLLGEGINDIGHEKNKGVIFLFLGFLLIAVAVFAFFFFGNYMLANRGV